MLFAQGLVGLRAHLEELLLDVVKAHFFGVGSGELGLGGEVVNFWDEHSYEALGAPDDSAAEREFLAAALEHGDFEVADFFELRNGIMSFVEDVMLFYDDGLIF